MKKQAGEKIFFRLFSMDQNHAVRRHLAFFSQVSSRRAAFRKSTFRQSSYQCSKGPERYSGSNDSIPLSEFKADRKYSAALLRSFADSASSARIDAAPAAQR